MNQVITYVICTSPHSGTAMLCDALARTGVAGRPAACFGGAAQAGFADPSGYVDHVLAQCATPNGVRGFSLDWHQAPALRTALRARRGLADPPGPVDGELHELLTDNLGEIRYVWLRRRNLLAQAIAGFRASTPPQAPAMFDYDAIQRYSLAVEQFDRAWFSYFMRRRLPALVVIQEDFAAGYENTVRGVLRHLAQAEPSIAIPPRTAAQVESDLREIAVTNDWQRRFELLQAQGPEPRYTPVRAARAARAEIPAPAAAPQEGVSLIAYDTGSSIRLPIDVAPATRAWMDEMPGRFAYRCLPLVIANQAGWLIRNTHALTVEWDGGSGVEGLRITGVDLPGQPYAISHFGSGILTFSIGYLFRTAPGYNLHVRGPINAPKDGIAALDAIVETDWTHSTFTMNWKLTRPHHPVTFAVGEAICMIAPARRGALEEIRPQVLPLAADAASAEGYAAWSDLRSTFNTALKNRMPRAVEAGWQRHYMQGLNVKTDQPAPGHQTGLSLAAFDDRRARKAQS